MQTCNPVSVALCLLGIISVTAVGRAEDAKEPQRVLRHAVFFKLKEGTSKEDARKVVDAFDQLPKKVDSIVDYQRGENVSPVGLDDGFTQCFLVTFKDEAGRAKYLPNPDHKAFGKVLGPHLDKVFVVDYWGKPEKARKDRELKHALFLKFKESASEAEVKDVVAAIEKIGAESKTVKAFEWGKNNSPETHDEGFTHAFMFTFDDAKGLREYATSEAHKELVPKIMAVAEKGRVLDFWTAEKK